MHFSCPAWILLIYCLLSMMEFLKADSIQWSTFVGDSRENSIEAVAVGFDGMIYAAQLGVGDDIQPDFSVGDNPIYMIHQFASDGSTRNWSAGIEIGYSASTPEQYNKPDSPNPFGYGSIAAIAVDEAGDVILAANGGVHSDWPTSNALQDAFADGDLDGMLLKMSASGDEILFSSYFGGSGYDRIRDVKVLPDGRIVLAGSTTSPDLPGLSPDTKPIAENTAAAFISILSPDGSTPKTYLYGSEYVNTLTDCYTVIPGPNETLWAGLMTSSAEMFVTEHAFQKELGGLTDGYLMQVSLTEGAILNATYYGGSSADHIKSLDLSDEGWVVFAGKTASRNLPLKQSFQNELVEGNETRDALFIAAWDPKISDLKFSSYFGGSLEESLAGTYIDNVSGDIWMAGWTASDDLPLLNPIQTANRGFQSTAFVCRLRQSGEWVFSSTLGGGIDNVVLAATAAKNGGLLLAGRAGSFGATKGFITTPHSALPGFQGGSSDGFLMQLNSGLEDNSNDLFEKSEWIHSFPITVQADNTQATSENFELPHLSGEAGPFRSLWWTWQAPEDGILEATTSAYYRGSWDSLYSSNFDTVMAVYQGESLPNLIKLAENDEDAIGMRTSALALNVTKGETYHLAVDGRSDGESGTVTLSLDFKQIVPNDNYVDRILLEETEATWSGNNQHATSETGEANVVLRSYGQSVWYAWESPMDGVVRLNLQGNGFRPEGRVFLDAASLEELTPYTYYQNAGSEEHSGVLHFYVAAGYRYALLVDALDENGGPFTASLEIAEPISNDTWSDAPSIHTIPYQSETVNTYGATRESLDPDLRLLGMNHTPAGLSLWWHFRAEQEMSLLWRCEADPEQAILIGLYQGDALGNLEPVAEAQHLSPQQVAFKAKPGIDYHLMLDQSLYGETGPIRITLVDYAPPSFESVPILNDEQGRILLTVNGIPGTTYILETSEDLVNWNSVDVLMLNDQQQQIHHPIDPDAAVQFFRLVESNE